MTSKKILILYSSTGLGHKTIAENIGWHLQSAGHNVKLADAFEVQPSKQLDWYNKLYAWVVTKFPFIWDWLYDTGYHLFTYARVPMARFHYSNIKRVIDEFQPDLVISTQAAPSAVMSYLKQHGLYKNVFAISFSDFHFHPHWLYPGADFYLANIPEQKQEMIQRGIPADRIFVCGITLKPKMSIDEIAVRTKLGLMSGSKVLLVSAGSLGIGLPESFLDTLVAWSAAKNVQVVIVSGKNSVLKQTLEKKYGSSAVVLGFYTPMQELYALASVYVTKPGGLSVCEALQYDLPLYITHKLPGQEKHNMRYLLKNKLVAGQYSVGNLVEREALLKSIEHELTDGTFKQSLQANPASSILINSASQESPVIGAVKAMFHA